MRFPATLFLILCLCFANLCRADTPPVQDVFAGNGTAGPFALSWSSIQASTETVSVNQIVQLRNLDYTLDPVAGVVTFTHSLPVTSAILVTYTLLPGQSQHSGGQTIPLSVDLLRSQTSYFSVDALGRQAAGAQNTLTLGAGLGWHGGQNTQIASRFVYTPATGPEAVHPADRTGLSVLGTLGTGWGLLSAGFSRAGSDIDPSGVSSLEAGHQVLTLNGTLTPAKTVRALLSFSRSDALDKTGPGPADTTQTLAVSVDAQANRTLDVSASLNTQDARGTAATQQQSVTLALTPQPAVQLDAGFLMRQRLEAGSSTATGTSEASVGGTLKPLPMLEMSGSYNRRAGAGGSSHSDPLDTSTARVTFAPLKTVKLVGTYAQNPDDGTASVQRLSRHGVSLEAKLGAFGLSGGCDWSRAYDAPNVEQTVHAALGLHFSAVTLFSLGYQTQQNLLDPAVPSATAYSVGFSHTLGDRFSLSVSGKRQETVTAPSPDYNATASLGMKF